MTMSTIIQTPLGPRTLSGSDGADPASATNDTTPSVLTPEALLAYCSSRLDSLDTQLKDFMTQQQHINQASAEETRVIEVVSQGGGRQEGGPGLQYNTTECQNHANQANAMIDVYDTCTTQEARDMAAEQFKLMTGRNIEDFAGGKPKITGGEIATAARMGAIPALDAPSGQARIDNLKSQQGDCSKHAEMNMIQVQALVSQRQLAVQLTTQLMQSLNETMKSVVGNIRS
jgi:hypothetical protein